jgi:hypothetical protein
LGKCLYIDLAIFHWLYSKLASEEKNIVETSKDKHGTTPKTPLEQHPFHQGQSYTTTMKLLAIPC